MPIPEQYAGDLCSCGRFLLQCSPIFSQQPSTYATDHSRVSIVLNLLRAAQWASALWESDSPICISFSVVMTEMKVLITLFRGKKLFLGYYPSVRAPSQLPITLLSYRGQLHWLEEKKKKKSERMDPNAKMTPLPVGSELH